MSDSSTFDLIRQHHSTGRALLYTMGGAKDEEVSAQGSWVFSSSGKRYLDLGSFAVFLLGHRHPSVIQSVRQQLDLLPLSSRSLPSGVFARACEKLASIAPCGLTKVMLLNSGAEAAEAALKLARAKTRRSPIFYLEGGYHGKSFGALSTTDADIFRTRFEPLLPDTHRVCRTDWQEVADAILTQKPAAVILEPIQGEGGVFELAPEYLRRIREACDRSATLLIFDEIQCGLGRTGKVWACDYAEVRPDILLTAKGLGGGVMPVSAIVATEDAYLPFDRDPILHSSTFGGNPLASAAVCATIDLIKEGSVTSQALKVGAALRSLLSGLIEECPDLFVEVSGKGCMLGLHARTPEIAGLFIRSCMENEVLVTPCLTTPHVIRFTPAVTLAREELDFACKAMRAATEKTRIELHN